ncbi:MAG TPA: transcription-repair coupling factor [Acidimicrobiales bacterium]|nr:transcription-repair coupling factor [Acidimicrobiales bacterium]
MRLSSLSPLLRDEPALAEVLGRSLATLAVPEAARAITVAHLAQRIDRRPVVVAVSTTSEAEHLTHDLEAFLGPDAVDLFPAWETLPFERVSPSVETMGRRLRTLWRVRTGVATVVVAPVRALVQRLGPHVEEIEPVLVHPGDQLDPVELVARLVGEGYRREYQVEHRGEVAVRGSIVDVYPSTADGPVRIDLWGDEVDRLSAFSVSDQRSRADLEGAEIFGCRELLPTKEVRGRAADLVATEPWGREQWERLAEGQIFDGMESWMPWLAEAEHTVFDLLPGDSGQILLVDPRRMRDRAADLAAEEADLAASLARTWGAAAGADADLPRLHLPFDALLATTAAPVWSLTTTAEGPRSPQVQASAWAPVVGDAGQLADRLRSLLADRYRVVLAADGDGSANRMAAALADEGVALTVHRHDDRTDAEALDLSGPGGHVVVAPLDRGFVLPNARLAVLAERDVTGRRRAHRPARPRRRDAAGFFDDLKSGDYVVHVQHGVARYGGIVTRAMGGVERDYLLLEYRGGDKLYVPSDQIGAVRHYTGGESPSLHRMGGADWQRAKAQARSATRAIAQELVALYQRRAAATGHAFAPDSPWQREMEEAFPYKETPDQARAIGEVKADMELSRPMDRLICGDVGFGKTEIALRAAFKAVQDGMQVAVLVPTTLLAQQHGTTFGDRLAPYPVRVEVLSRFLTAGQADQVLRGLADGEVDIVIGTHRLLSGDVRFKRLGLLVVDEEQRFGVTHKEAIKEIKADVDVLTLTATPIPRTLEMSLTGIRDLSLLHTPPAERQPILTYVGEYDERAVAEALRRELLREGQVFFVHNRVSDIDRVADDLRDLVPEVRIAVAHGQMDEGTLERVVLDFWHGDYDVLVCTTIIESGIDMPAVNTLVVDRADRLGLGQLHQLRGRVGRAGSRAYAYLFHPRDHALSEEAYERLKTIGEATELGSGFKIAMRDLEIRGAGHLLGESQSGHIAAVGYDLYVQMVSEAVAELKGERPPEHVEIKLDIPLDAHLPDGYVAKEELRLEAYRRLAGVTTATEVDDVRREWEDRYGPVPPPAEALLAVARLRAECHRTGVRQVSANPNAVGRGLMVRLSPVRLRASAAVRLRRLHKDATYREELAQLVIPLPAGADPATVLTALLEELLPPDAPAVAS